ARTHKILPLYMFADGVPDPNITPVQTPAGCLGILMCYDSDFSYICRHLTRDGAEILVVPTMEKYEWGDWLKRQRLDLCRARAMEEVRWLVRPASSGISAIVSPAGEVTTRLDQGQGFVAGTAH